MAHLARDASRWAAVHGSDYANATKNPAATASDIYNQVIAPKAVGLDLSNLTYTVTWNNSNSTSHTSRVNNEDVVVANTVTVSITYKCARIIGYGNIVLASTSTAVMTF